MSIALGLAFAGLVVGVIIGVAYVALLSPGTLVTHSADPITLVLVSLIGEAPAVLAILLYLPRVSGLTLRELGFVAPPARAIGIGLLGIPAALLAAQIGSAVVSIITHSAQHPQATEQLFAGLKGWQQIALFSFLAVVFAPLAEETVFRIFLFNLLRRHWGVWFGALLSAALFGLAHGDLANALPLACVGLVFAGVYYLSRNAFGSMISHAGLNLTTLLVIHYFPNMGA